MATNNKISNLISTQVPFFVRNDHDTFVRFIEAYYEFLEANNVVDVAKTLPNNLDIDQSVDLFTQHFYNTYINAIPREAIADKTLILKHVKDFYRARGTEKSIEFLLRILFGDETTEFYYPKTDILRTSDGKWFIEKSLKIADVRINGIANNELLTVQNFKGKKVYGNTSNAFAVVEKVDTYYEFGTLVNELKISGQYKNFTGGEELFALFTENGMTKSITANLFSGAINSVVITDGGQGYEVGDPVSIESNTGNGGLIVVSAVTTGNIEFISALSGGAGFQVNNALFFSGGGGSGANAVVDIVQDDGYYHPNSYNIAISTIELEANTLLSNAVYSNLNASHANVTMANALSFFTYANTGPISSILLLANGINYSSQPTISVSANTRIKELGILGRMQIIGGGVGYQTNDIIAFTNQFGSFGYGANGKVSTVNATGAITKVEFIAEPGSLIGGQGFREDLLPLVSVISQNVSAHSANIMVTAILGSGEDLTITPSTIGSIIDLSVLARGSGYDSAPTLNLAAFGDGTAQAYATIITGTYQYPGRYLNDDGHLSGYNFLEDRDYYQNYSYVVRVKRSIEKYRKALKELIHPMGMKLFGEYLFVDEDSPGGNSDITDMSTIIFKYAGYSVNSAGNISISYASHGVTINDEIGLEFETGNVINGNGVFTAVGVPNSNYFFVSHTTTLTAGNTGNVYFAVVE